MQVKDLVDLVYSGFFGAEASGTYIHSKFWHDSGKFWHDSGTILHRKRAVWLDFFGGNKTAENGTMTAKYCTVRRRTAQNGNIT